MNLNDLNKDKYLSYFEQPLKIIVIYEHHRYDASDYDTLCKPQLTHLKSKVSSLNPVTRSGRVTELKEANLKLVVPKPAILGSSSFDTLRYESIKDDTVFVLTPTQAACYFLTLDDEQLAEGLLEELIAKHPVNLKKINLQIRTEQRYKALFHNLKSKMENIQKQTVDQIIEKGQTHLGKIY